MSRTALDGCRVCGADGSDRGRCASERGPRRPQARSHLYRQSDGELLDRLPAADGLILIVTPTTAYKPVPMKILREEDLPRDGTAHDLIGE
jgi:hypothetical protein